MKRAWCLVWCISLIQMLLYIGEAITDLWHKQPLLTIVDLGGALLMMGAAEFCRVQVERIYGEK